MAPLWLDAPTIPTGRTSPLDRAAFLAYDPGLGEYSTIEYSVIEAKNVRTGQRSP